MKLYRDNFRPSASHAKPYAILGTHVVCADTDEEADRLAKTVDLNIVRRAKGEYLPLASPEDAAAYDYTPVDRARIAQEPHQAVGRRAGDGEGAARTADRGDAGRRS